MIYFANEARLAKQLEGLKFGKLSDLLIQFQRHWNLRQK